MFPRAARVFVAAELLLGIAYFVLPPSGPRAVVYGATSLGMVVAVVVGVRMWWPSRPMAWYLIAVGQLLFTVGDAYSFYHEWVLGLEVPFPSIADGFHLVFYPVLAAGLLLLVRGRAPGRDAASLIDATIITTGIGMLSWVFLIGPYVRLPDLSLLERLVSVAYPLGDVLLLAVAVRLWRTGGNGAIASRLLAFGLFALLAVDTVYGLSMLNGAWQIGGPLDAVWMLYYVAPWPGRAAPVDGVALRADPAEHPPDQDPAGPAGWRLSDAPGHAGHPGGPGRADRRRRDRRRLGRAVPAHLARMGGLASEVAMQTERKRAMQTVLRATEQERIRLAADLHDGPVQELTALRYGLTRARNRVQRGQAEQAEGLLAELEDELAAGITGLRRLMAELRPAVLDEQGLEVALHNQVRAFEATSGVACAISTGLKSRLAPDLETVLYRVTQETLNNVGKHAGASRVTVSLAAENGSVRLRINDDGNRLRPGRRRQAPQRGPLRPGRHARAGRDGRRPPHHRLRPWKGDERGRGDGEPSLQQLNAEPTVPGRPEERASGATRGTGGAHPGPSRGAWTDA
jgi:signal transduction histidine kinase